MSGTNDKYPITDRLKNFLIMICRYGIQYEIEYLVTKKSKAWRQKKGIRYSDLPFIAP